MQAGSCYKTLAIGLDTHLTMYLDSSNEVHALHTALAYIMTAKDR